MPPMSVDPPLLEHQVDDRVLVVASNSVELASVSPSDVAGELDRHHLQPEAQPEARDAVCRGRTGPRRSCPRRRATPKPPGITMPSRWASGRRRAGPRPPRPGSTRSRRAAPWWKPACLRRLDDRQVGVGQFDVLADQADADGLGRRPRPWRRGPPRAVEVGLGVDAQDVADELVEALVVEDQRQLVDVLRGVGGVDDGPRLDVAEVGDLALEIVGQSEPRCGRRSRRAGCRDCAARSPSAGSASSSAPPTGR